jgi:hypothetical protein
LLGFPDHYDNQFKTLPSNNSDRDVFAHLALSSEAEEEVYCQWLIGGDGAPSLFPNRSLLPLFSTLMAFPRAIPWKTSARTGAP